MCLDDLYYLFSMHQFGKQGGVAGKERESPCERSAKIANRKNESPPSSVESLVEWD